MTTLYHLPKTISDKDLLEILQAAANGETIKETAKRLNWHPQTIYNRRRILFETLQAKNMPQAVFEGCRRGWLDMRPAA